MTEHVTHIKGIPVEKICGYAGKILWVDLDTHETHTLSTYDYAEFIGGKAMAFKLQWDFGKPGVKNGLDPESLLIFITGPASGMPWGGGARMDVCYQQCLQEPSLWGSSSVSGYFTPELKQCGYDGIIFRGKSENPVYMYITDKKIEFFDASNFWDWDIQQTDDYVRQKLGGDKRIRIASVGTAGANKNAMSLIAFDKTHYAGQHPGGVMGAKNLKAVAVRGDKPIKVANPQYVFEWRHKHANVMDTALEICGKRGARTGIGGQVSNWTAYKELSVSERNFGPIKRRLGCYGCHISCHTWTEDIDSGPAGTVISCGVNLEYGTSMALADGRMNWSLTEQGDATTDRYRVEAIMSAGSKSTRAAHSALKWMNTYGISAYEMMGMRTPNNMIQHLIWNPRSSGKFKEWIEGELEAEYGTTEFIKRFIAKTAKREGLVGEWMADGVEKAAKMLRDEYERFGITKEDGELAWEAYQRCYPIHGSFEHHFYRPTFADPRDKPDEIRVSPIATMVYCLGSRQMGPNNHTCTELYEESQQNSRGHCFKFADDERAACRYLDKDGEPVLFGQNYLPDMENFYTLDGRRSEPVRPNYTKGLPLAAINSMAMGLYNESLCTCDYIAPMVAGSDQVSLITFPIPKSDDVMDKLCDPEFATHPEWTAEQFEACTGIPTSLEDLYRMAWRALCVERAVQVRDSNRNRDDNDKPNAVFLNRKDHSGIPISEKDLEEGLAIIYELFGWDPQTGQPTREGLHMWGLDDIAEGLEAAGRLSETHINTNLRAELIEEGHRETEKNAAYYKEAFENRDRSKRFQRIRQDATSGYRKNN